MMKELVAGMSRWARANGKPRPKDQAGMNALVAEYLAAQPGWDEIPDGHTTHVTWNGVMSQIVDAAPEQDDWDQMMQDRQDAMDEGGGDDLSRDVLMMEKQHAVLHSQAPFTRTNPPSALNGSLGGQAQLTSGALPVNVAYWNGSSDAETTPVSCTFVPVQQLTEIANTDITEVITRPYGIVRFGTKGFLTEAEVDIALGCQFTLSGSMVTLSVAMPPLPANGVGGVTASTMILAGMLSFHPVVRTAPLYRTRYIDVLASAGSETVKVPPFAKNVIAFRHDMTHSFTLNFKTWSGTTKYSTPSIAANANMTVPIPISGDIINVQFTDGGQAGTISAELIFELSI